IQNARQTVFKLQRDSYAVSRAIQEKRVEILASLYHMETGEVELI
ncbi:MAG: hypothetical protein QOJ65_1657, partial [Fimbriimonadaceae bacterium]|nr:hypothetical protein [Fimbriimonadaceae bacterium]